MSGSPFLFGSGGVMVLAASFDYRGNAFTTKLAGTSDVNGFSVTSTGTWTFGGGQGLMTTGSAAWAVSIPDAVIDRSKNWEGVIDFVQGGSSVVQIAFYIGADSTNRVGTVRQASVGQITIASQFLGAFAPNESVAVPGGTEVAHMGLGIMQRLGGGRYDTAVQTEPTLNSLPLISKCNGTYADDWDTGTAGEMRVFIDTPGVLTEILAMRLYQAP